MMAKNSCRHSSTSIEATAAPSASDARRQPEDRPAGLDLAVGQAVGAHADRDHRDAGLLQDRHRRFDRFGAEEADDDSDLGGDQIVGRLGAAFGRALVVDDVERGGRVHRSAAASAPARTCAPSRADGPVSGAATPISSASA